MTTIYLQPLNELEDFYNTDDPWGYFENTHDAIRLEKLLALLPAQNYARALDIGCGNGFITLNLPGKAITGVDISEKAAQWAKANAHKSHHSQRFNFFACSIFDLSPEVLGHFDLIIITGVLYTQYIGTSMSLIREIVDNLLLPEGVLVSCHIEGWGTGRFPYNQLDLSLYQYRDYWHRLEVYKK